MNYVEGTYSCPDHYDHDYEDGNENKGDYDDKKKKSKFSTTKNPKF